MKKAVFFLLIFFTLGCPLFSQSHVSESWLSFGAGYGNSFEQFSRENTRFRSYVASPGFIFGGYRFFDNSNLGIFADGFFAVPVRDSLGNSDKSDVGFQTGLIIGPGYRIALSDRLAFRATAGLTLFLASFVYSEHDPAHGTVEYETMSIDFGPAADIGFRYRIGRAVFLSAGSIFTANFGRLMWMDATFKEMQTQKSSIGWERNFFSFGIRPYITVGFNLLYIW